MFWHTNFMLSEFFILFARNPILFMSDKPFGQIGISS